MAAAAVVLMLVTGCQGDAEPSASGTSDSASPSVDSTTAEASASASSSPQPSPASSLGPAVNLPVPVKPALADENSKEGLEAFTRYWLELLSYGYETNDWASFQAVTDPACATCSNVTSSVQRVFGSGGWIIGGETRASDFSTDFVLNTQGSVSAVVQVEQDASQVYAGSGLLESDDPASDSRVNVIFADYRNGDWFMMDFGAPEGTE